VRASELRCLALAALAVAAAACSPHVLTVVDPCGGDGEVACSSTLPQDPLLDGLVGWWRFEDGVGSLVARDSSGHANNGNLVGVDGTMATTWPPGRVGEAIELQGAGYVEVPRSDSTDSIVDQVSMAAWIYIEGAVPVDFGTAISKEIGNTLDQHYHLAIDTSDNPSLFITTSKSGAHPTASSPVPRFTWTLLVGTYDGANAKLYVDGNLVEMLSVTGPFATDTTPVEVGANGNGPANGVSERFPGQLDEVMLYKRALTAEEILRLSHGDLPVTGDGGAP